MASSSTQKPSSSAPTGKFNFDVFLSFRGEDTRYNFTDHLFVNLDRMGINTFRDDKLERGEEIKQELLGTIEGSRFSIIVFSERYADSKWCLDELTKIMECRKEMDQIVLPVFYHVDPSHVRNQTGSFGKAFAKHETTVDEEKVQRWRAAMTEASSLSGWHVKDEYEFKYIEEIVEVIHKRLNPKLLHVGDDIVGMDFQLEELKSLINSQLHDVRVIGIYGIGGIGKTTIAKIVYNGIQCEFNGASFLENVKESFKRGCQLQLQQELLHGIMGQKIELSNINDGINIIKARLGSKKVLVVIDDVDHLEQLRSLVGSKKWFGAGTRIIITTRDQHLLYNYGVDVTYEAKALCYEDAIQLFNMHAFKQNAPKEDYINLSLYLVDYAQGLPLALKVLGASLHGMTVDEWKSASGKLKKNLNREINDVLRTSFDMLESSEKRVFLDIACFFKGEDKAFVLKILDGCNLYATCNVKVLCDKCLITISNNMIKMHDLIQQMGWAIVREECPEDPSKWSRLWNPNDIYDAFSRQKGMKNIETLSLDLLKLKKIQFSPGVFSKMKKLRLLKVYYNHHHSLLRKEDKMCLPKGFGFPPNLKYLHWEGLESLPLNFHGENLVAINLQSSNIKELWGGDKCFAELRFLDLGNSQQLMKMPKFSSMPKLERLNLEGCTSFCNLHFSVGAFHEMKFLRKLNFSGTGIKELPSSIGSLTFLELLNLSKCSKLEKFPDVFGNMGHLRKLDFSGTGIKELPSSIGSLTFLEILNLSKCSKFEKFPDVFGNMGHLRQLDFSGTGIKELPSSIGYLESLESLNISYCLNFEKFPGIQGNMKCLKYLYLRNTAIKELPNSIGFLDALQVLSLSYCSNLEKFPVIQRNMGSLRRLYVNGTAIKEFPCSIGHFTGLNTLSLENCKNLSGLLPSSIYGLKYLKQLFLNGCSNVEAFSEIMVDMEHLQELCLQELAITELPSSLIERLKNLRLLKLDNCENLVTLPNSIGDLTHLIILSVRNCPKLHKLPDNLRSLQRCLRELCVAGCNLMEGAIPRDLWCLSSLGCLDVSENHIRCIPTGIIQLSKLRYLRMNHCPNIEEIPELPSSLRLIEANGCPRLETLSSDPTHLLWSSLLNCLKSEIKDLLGRNRELYKGYNTIRVVIPGSSGIPEWISHKSMGREVGIEFPKNWYKDDGFLGFAVFFHYLPLDDDDDDNKYRLKISYDNRSEDDSYGLPNPYELVRDYDIRGFGYDKGGTSDPALFVVYFSQIAISDLQQYNKFKFRFNCYSRYGNNKALKVKSCGIHLLYAQAQDHHHKRSSHDHPAEDHPHHKRSRRVASSPSTKHPMDQSITATSIELNDPDDSSLWSSTIDKIFIDIMVGEVNKGNMRNGVFGQKIWTRIHEDLKSKGNWNYSLKQVKQKFNRFRTKHREFSELLKQTGFGWNAETNTVQATEEMWQNYLRAHPKAVQFRKKGCELYKLLGLIFDKSTATGVLHHASTQDPPTTDDEIELENQFLYSSTHVDLEANSTSHGEPINIFDGSTSQHGKRTSVKRKIKKENRSQQMSDALQAWTEVAKAKAEASLPKAKRYKKAQNLEESNFAINLDFSLTNCVRLLEKMEQIDDDTYMKAVEKFKDLDWREIFVTMSIGRKKAWLARL